MERNRIESISSQRILSLYDGMSCGMIAFKELGIDVKEYYAYEIEKNAIKVSQHNFPDIVQCGDTFEGDYKQYEGIDWLIGGSPCFTAGTYIKTQNGRKRIDEIKVGDYVPSHIDGHLHQVTKFYDNGIKSVFDVSFSDDYICTCTPNHKFKIYDPYLQTYSWKEIGYITPFEFIVMDNGKYVNVLSKDNYRQEHVYDIEVEDTHEFILENGIAVHNCTYWSIAKSKTRETVASGIGWDLFQQYVRALHEAKPKYFIYENNKSMSDEIKRSISESFGLEPICINSALVSAQTRQRLYWCGIRQEDGTYKKADIEQPEDMGILLKDILELQFSKELSDNEMQYMVRTIKDGRNHFDFDYFHNGNKDKSQCLTANLHKGVPYNVLVQPVCVAQRTRYEEDGTPYQHFEPNLNGKINAMTTVLKDNLIADPVRAMNYELESVTNKDAGIIAMLDMPGQHEMLRRVYGENGKAPTLNICGGGNREPKVFTNIECIVEFKSNKFKIYTVRNGMINVKGVDYPIKLADGEYVIRKLTPNECKRLQTVPDWYEFPVANTHIYKLLGNGWTVRVIMHLIKSMLEN